MGMTEQVSRRRFFGGVAAAMGYLTLIPRAGLRLTRWNPVQGQGPRRPPMTVEEYDGLAKLANNENPYGPPESVMKAMTQAFKYANRYGYPDGGIVTELAKFHRVEPENIMLGAGSGEILDVTCDALLQDGRKVVGAEPSYDILYQHATGLKSDHFKIPLTRDYRQDIPATIHAVKTNYREVGFVYLCNPNNPTGRIVTKQEVAQLLDAIPEDVVVLIDEAYHHFVDDPAYATSVPYVLEGRQVMVTRTFSKIAALAGMRLGYAIAPRELLARLRPWGTGSINAIVKWGGVAALKDTASQARVKQVTLELRGKTTAELEALGYPVIPSDANFFMVHLRRPVQPVVDEFRKKGVLVGRPFTAMPEHLRVSVGTPEEMGRFMVAFKEILGGAKAASNR
jgi:histidinol-phosphate aminotransferase